MAKIILCTHNSGGVGKTTLAVNITGILISQHGKTLLVDCDDQLESWVFYNGTKPNKNKKFNTIIEDKLDTLENKNQEKITQRRVDLDEYENIVIDIDSPLVNTITTMFDNEPDFVFIPINLSRRTQALNNLSSPIEVIVEREKFGYFSQVVIVPLGIKREDVLNRINTIGEMPKNYQVAQEMRRVGVPMDKAIYGKRRYLWEYAGYTDIKQYFTSLVKRYINEN
ncbi:MAG: AAA family ATPase [Thiomargarita sp.]|nr:AAA family ATPase [Thiomargarita sp.]